jgi:hypothetical protein
MGLGMVERNLGAGRERRFEEKPGAAKIISRHGGELRYTGRAYTGQAKAQWLYLNSAR